MTKRKKKHKEDNCPMSQFQKMYKALGTDKEAVMEMVEKDLKTTALLLRSIDVEKWSEGNLDPKELDSSIYFAHMFLKWRIDDELECDSATKH